ncbi:MAG TPA: hypothetical protein DD417_04860 [Elusimicrobia bacterium]|nr:hypothetical protein [Elusimicrobiota bacterium]
MKKSALIIDDDPDEREIARYLLRQEGFEVSEAADGREGVAAAIALKPDLVLTDLMMPVMHGYEVCERIRAEPSLKHTRILVVSSKSFDNDLRLALKAGADAYLVKPYHKIDFINKVKELSGGGPAGPGSEPTT